MGGSSKRNPHKADKGQKGLKGKYMGYGGVKARKFENYVMILYHSNIFRISCSVDCSIVWRQLNGFKLMFSRAEVHVVLARPYRGTVSKASQLKANVHYLSTAMKLSLRFFKQIYFKSTFNAITQFLRCFPYFKNRLLIFEYNIYNT